MKKSTSKQLFKLQLLQEFRTFKTRVKDSTWKTKYKPVLDRTLEICSEKKKATNGPQLCEFVLNKWIKGTSKSLSCKVFVSEGRVSA